MRLTILCFRNKIINGLNNDTWENFVIQKKLFFCIHFSFSSNIQNICKSFFLKRKIKRKISYVNRITHFNKGHLFNHIKYPLFLFGQIRHSLISIEFIYFPIFFLCLFLNLFKSCCCFFLFISLKKESHTWRKFFYQHFLLLNNILKGILYVSFLFPFSRFYIV